MESEIEVGALARSGLLAALVIAVFLAAELTNIVLVFLFTVIPVVVAEGKTKTVAKQTLILGGTIYLPLLIVWGLIRGAPPSGEIASSLPVNAGYEYASIVYLRILSLASMFTALLGSLRPAELASYLSSLRAPRSFVYPLLGAFAVLPEIQVLSSNSVKAQYARCLSDGKGFRQRAMDLVLATKTTSVQIIRNAVVRNQLGHPVPNISTPAFFHLGSNKLKSFLYLVLGTIAIVLSFV